MHIHNNNNSRGNDTAHQVVGARATNTSVFVSFFLLKFARRNTHDAAPNTSALRLRFNITSAAPPTCPM
jgi:hypothetical protein